MIKEIILAIIPRFVEDRVAVCLDENGSYAILCLESQVVDSDKGLIEFYGTIRTFTWLGFAAGGKVKVDKVK